MISSCGHDSRNKYWGDVAGDQSGTEWYVRPWYKGGWDEVFVHPDAAVREAIAKVSTQGANNPNVGYDQYQRLTFFENLKNVKWDASKIAVKCESDCSASTAACAIAAGHLTGNPKIYNNVSPYAVSWNIGSQLVKAGFIRFTAAKYLTSDAYLPRGAIVNRSNQHVVINLTDGLYAKETIRKAGGYDSREDIVNDSDIQKIADKVSATVPKATWTFTIDGRQAQTRLKEASNQLTKTTDPTGRGKNLNDHDHIKWIAVAVQETNGEVEALNSKFGSLEKKLDWLIEKMTKDETDA